MSDPAPIPSGPVFLPRMASRPPAQDFEALMEQAAREWLPQWCAGNWTDFNHHDPGLMLLEQIVYASTELSYRADFEIDRLLCAATGRMPWRENSLYAPTEILPMQPLTAGDYARLLYDRLPQIVQARIERLPAPAVAPTVAGRLSATLAINPQLDRPATERLTPEQVLRVARRLLDSHCNLGERFEVVAAEPPETFRIAVQAELAPGAPAERVRGDIYHAVMQALWPGARFRTLAEACASQTLDAALTGPLLQRGIVVDEDLPGLLAWPEAQAQAVEAIRRLTGLKTIRAIELTPTTDGTDDATPRFHLPDPDVRLNAPATADLRSAAAGAMVNRHPDLQLTRLLPESTWQMPRVPDAPLSEIGEYESIQNGFPPCFGIQLDGLPADAPAIRRAQARQLKGYLLMFEQLMANYFAQLEHTADYFSSRPQSRTVFIQPLAMVPEVMPLLAGYPPDDPDATPAEKAASAQHYWADPINPYLVGLKAAAEDEAQFLARRDRVLDHLLARFNEAFAGTPADPTYETIRNKEDLLRAYPALSGRRAAAADLTRAAAADQPRARTGLEEKIQLLLRRDTQSLPPPLGELSAQVQVARPADFYFVLETIRFLPRDQPPGAGEAWAVPLAALRSGLFHVLLNWTYQPIDAGFQSYVQALVEENAPAHLWSRFIWLETQPQPEPATEGFLLLFRVWAEAGYPPLETVATAEPPPADTIAVRAGSPAALLLRWLLAHTPAAS